MYRIIHFKDFKDFKRLDHFLAKKVTHYSRTFLKSLFLMGKIGIEESEENPKTTKLELKKMPPSGTKIVIEIPPPIPLKAKPEDIPLESKASQTFVS